jgi:hypothetical protein
MAHKKVSNITNNKNVKTLYHDISSNVFNAITQCDKHQSNTIKPYVCDICDYVTKKICNYNRHLSSKKHIENVSKINKKYNCEFCDYNTSIKSHYDKHLSSKKHIKKRAKQLSHIYGCDICDYTTNIKYNYNKHLSSKSHINKTQTITPIKNDSQSYSSIMEQLKNMREEQTKIIEEQAKIIEEQAKNIEEQTKMNQIISIYLNKAGQA